MTAVERVVAALELRDCRPRRSGDGWEARCPAHDDTKPSLTVGVGRQGRALVKCQAAVGCDTEAIVGALGLTVRDLFDQAEQRTERRREIARYPYVDEHGELLFEVIKFQPKDFRQRRPDGRGGWIWRLEDTRRVLYRLPQVIAAVAAGQTIYVAEGEKDVEALERAGVVATCNPQGAGKWKPTYSDTLVGAHIVLIVDRDAAGIDHARAVSASLTAVGCTVRTVQARTGKDAADHLAAGHTVEDLDPVELEAGDAADGDRDPEPTVNTHDSDHTRYTDVGNARRLVAAHGHQLRWVHAWAAWLVWDGTRWRPDTKGQVVERAKKVAAALWLEVAALTDSDERKRAAKWALQSESAPRIDAMIRLARSSPGIPVDPDELDADPWLLNTPTGTIDLRTGHARPNRPEDNITKIAGIGHDPTADAPVWRAFLEQILPDPDVRDFVQRSAGYALTGSTAEQVLFFAHGGGSNGKSTLINALLQVFGDYGNQAEDGLLLARRDVHPTGLADLHGARLVISSEIDQGRRLGEAQVKQLTGSDRMKARKIGRDFFEWTATHKIWLVANHRPEIRGTDHAIWRRIRLIPFDVTIDDDDRDTTLPDKLAHELPGILNWALDGCDAWRAGGLGQPLAVQLATAAYRADMDVLGDFIADRCVTFPEAHVSASALYEAYIDWCRDNGEDPKSQRALGAALTERGYVRHKSGRWQWRGIGLAGRHMDPSPDKGPDKPAGQAPCQDRWTLVDPETGSAAPHAHAKESPETKGQKGPRVQQSADATQLADVGPCTHCGARTGIQNPPGTWCCSRCRATHEGAA